MLVSVSDGASLFDVAVDCPPEATVGLVADAICSTLGLRVNNPTVRLVSRSAQAVGRGERLLAAGMHDGDTVAVVPDREAGRRPRAVATLTALSGPTQGRIYAIAPGESRIGRDPGSADVVVGDPAVSRLHVVLRVSDTIEVADAGSTNGVTLGGRPLIGTARIEPGESFIVGDTELVLGRVGGDAQYNVLGVPFNPTPRIFAPFSGPDIEYPAPPVQPRRLPIPILSALLPLLVGAGLAVATHSVVLLAFMLLSPLLIFSSTYESRRQQASEHADAMADFAEAVDDLVDQQALLQADEVRLRHEGSPPVTNLAAWAKARDIRVWERAADHHDALNLRIGTAVLPTQLVVSIASGGRQRDRKRLEERIAPTRRIVGLPVEIALLDAGHVGIAGTETADGLARALVTQAATLHSPAFLSIAAIIDAASADGWQWLKWLPHTRSPQAPVPGPLLCSHAEAAVELVERLTSLVRSRLAASQGQPPVWSSRVLVLVNDAAPIDPARLAELYAQGARAGVHVVFVGRSPNVIPRACGAVVVAGATADTASVAFSADGRVVRDVTVESVTGRSALAVSRALAPMVDVSAPAPTAADLPSRVALVDILGGPQVMVDAGLVAERWAESRGLTAVLGAVSGSLLRLDVRTDGPHALVAGTTGAGKSELLQSLICALALSHSPRKVNFFLVDYKGGAAFKECKDLPHSVGLVTDLNAQEVHRALVSLDAEIKRRELLLQLAGVKDLVDHEALGRPDTPANLLIIVDEFAALAKEVPEFVAGVVDVAQRGRSLGMHLVLATQRPAGVISESIRANTNLRIALRVGEDHESTDVVGEPTAAHISRDTPGRGVYRIGPKDIRVFQAGYVGGRTSLGQHRAVVHVRPFELEGIGAVSAEPASRSGGDTAAEGEHAPTDLHRIVEVTALAADSLKMSAPHRPWLAPLPGLLDLASLAASTPVTDGCVLVGQLDDPRNQRRRPAELSLARSGSVLVIGAGRSGKTAFLRTVAAAISLKGGEAMDIYAIDFAGRGLAMLADLPYVGDVIAGDDGERLARLFAMLQAIVARRADLFADAGVADLADYRRRTGSFDERRTVVLLDGIQAFEAAYETVDRGRLVELLPRLIGDGRAAGVHFVITSDRRASVRSAVFGLINTLVVLRQSSVDELSNLNLRADAIAVDAPPGRCFIGGLEGQLALLGPPEGDGQATALAELAASLPVDRLAPAVPRMPVAVNRADVPVIGRLAPGRVVVGLDGVKLEPVTVDLLRDHLCVLGRRRSGRTTALGVLAAGLAGSPRGPALVLVAAKASPLRPVAPWTAVIEGESGAVAFVEDLTEKGPGSARADVVVFIDDLTDLGDDVDATLIDLLRACHPGIHLVVAADTRKAKSSYAGSVLGELRQAQRGLVLRPNLPDDEDLFETPIAASSTLRFPPGRGFVVDGDQSTLVQVLLR